MENPGKEEDEKGLPIVRTESHQIEATREWRNAVQQIRSPWLELSVLVSRLTADFVGICILAGLGHLTEFALETIQGHGFSIAIGPYIIHSVDIVRYGDFAIFVGFIGINAFRVLDWLRSR